MPAQARSKQYYLQTYCTSLCRPPFVGRWAACRPWAKRGLVLVSRPPLTAIPALIQCTSYYGAPLCWYWRAKANNLTSRLDPSDSASVGALANVDKGGRRSIWWVPGCKLSVVVRGGAVRVVLGGTLWTSEPWPGDGGRGTPSISPWPALRPWQPPEDALAVTCRPSRPTPWF